jgi:hypothetical protein
MLEILLQARKLNTPVKVFFSSGSVEGTIAELTEDVVSLIVDSYLDNDGALVKQAKAIVAVKSIECIIIQIDK